MNTGKGCDRFASAFIAAGAPTGGGERIANDYDEIRIELIKAEARRKQVYAEISTKLQRRIDVVKSVVRKLSVRTRQEVTSLALGRLGWMLEEWSIIALEDGYVTIWGRVRSGKRMVLEDIDIPFAFFSLSDRELASIVREEVYSYFLRTGRDKMGDLIGRRKAEERMVRRYGIEIAKHQSKANKFESLISKRGQRSQK